MKSSGNPRVTRLEDLPNIGRSIAADLRGLGISSPEQLSTRDPLKVYHQLSGPMGTRHDPCVFYTLLAADHFLKTGESSAWWNFTASGKEILRGEK